MKKLLIVSALCSAVLLTACSSRPVNELAEAELSEREQLLLSTAADWSFAFDYTADDSFTAATIQIEKYENGKKTDTPVSDLTVPLQNESAEGTVIAAVSLLDDQLLFFTNMSTSDSGIRNMSRDELASLSNMAVLTSTNTAESLPLSGDMLLGAVLFTATEAGTPVSSLSIDFYEQQDGYLKELEEYDIAYIIHASFE